MNPILILAELVHAFSRLRWRLKMLVLRRLFVRTGRNLVFDPDGTYTFSMIEFGDDVYIGLGARFSADGVRICIGNWVIMGPGVTIMAGDHNTSVVGTVMRHVKEKLPDDDCDVCIEADVWMGANATILKGVAQRYAQAGFPTKLVESFSLGVPILTNLTSDIGQYVRDSLDGVILGDCPPEVFAAGGQGLGVAAGVGAHAGPRPPAGAGLLRFPSACINVLRIHREGEPGLSPRANMPTAPTQNGRSGSPFRNWKANPHDVRIQCAGSVPAVRSALIERSWERAGV